MRGEVHDPRAFAVSGVAGHAGLFSTADDLAKFCRMILAGGRLGKARILSPYGVLALTRPRFYGDAKVRALGFDMATPYSSNRGDLFPVGSVGHTGFTGTSLWIDPASRTFVVFLSNRVHPAGTGDVGRLRAVVATIAAASDRAGRPVEDGRRSRAGSRRESRARRSDRGRLPADRRPPGRPRHERHRPLARRPVDGRGAAVAGGKEGRSQSRNAVFPRARPPSRRGRVRRRQPGYGHGSSGPIALRRVAAAPSGGSRRARRSGLRHPGRRHALLHLPGDAGLRSRGGGPGEGRRRGARPARSDRRLDPSRGRSPTGTSFPSRRTTRSPFARA